MVRPDFPTPMNARPQHFADIGDEVVVELVLRALDADTFDVFGNKIETFVREIEIVRRSRHRRTKLRDQGIDVGNQPIFEWRIVAQWLVEP